MLYRLTNLTKGDEIASFASIVLETAQSPLCKKLRQGAVDSLTLYAGRMLENLRAQGEQNLKIVLSGGLFKSDCFRAQAVEGETDTWTYGESRIWMTEKGGKHVIVLEKSRD